MKFCVLGSSSRGNCTLIDSGETRLLIDAGFSGKGVQQRLAQVGYAPQALDGILVTHEHSDHIRGVGVLARRYGLPVYANPKTHQAAAKVVGQLPQPLFFTTGHNFSWRDLQIHPFSISHDSLDPVGFTINNGHLTVGYCTDTGRITRLIQYHLQACHGVVLEANHDPQLLREGGYPEPLKQRIASNQGHLSNQVAAETVRELRGKTLQAVIFSHLSESNNRPELVSHTIGKILGKQHPENPIMALGHPIQPAELVVLH